MVKYTCPTCCKEFNRKSNYDYHMESKKNPCKAITKINQKLPKITKINQNNDNCVCTYCGVSFVNIYTLKRHIDSRCKVKKEDDDNKKNIFELLLEQEKKEKELLNNKVDELQNQLLELTKTIKELSSKSATIINNNNYGNVNNITIPLEKLSKFGKEDLTKISQKEFLKIKNYQGVAIFLETAKLIYNNHSMNKTVYVTDYSRKKAMIW